MEGFRCLWIYGFITREKEKHDFCAEKLFFWVITSAILAN